MNLDEDDIRHLELILDDLKENQWNSLFMNSFPFVGTDIETLEHIVAKLRNGRCEDCGEEFNKDI